MIRSFRSQETQEIFEGNSVAAFRAMEAAALKRLILLNAARSLLDLSNMRSNRLEKLHADRAGQYSIRVNDQYRICFRWKGVDVFDVELVDYH
ncbi:MAG: type II toxin-antitoxin system RelE/ParE family toxin [Acidobacteriota bacterium]